MNRPKVSICIPCRNTRPFLEERRQCIDAQSFGDYEVIVVDDGSEDGSREFFDEWALADQRVKVYGGPGKGLYAGWNDSIGRAKGDFVYIATSDDTMADDLLEKMVAALDAHPDCGIAHCNLKALGDHADRFNHLWAGDMLFVSSSGDLRDRKHIRKSPFDSLLLLTGHTVYISITQLLIRRRLFDEIGYFDGRWAGSGDFHWHMRACFRTNTIHVPDTWGGWRLHPGQATSLSDIDSPTHRAKIEQMIDDALSVSWIHLPTLLQQGLQSGWRNFFYDKWYFETMIPKREMKFARTWFILSSIFRGSKAARNFAWYKISGISTNDATPHDVVSGWLAEIGYETPLVEVL